MASQSVGIGEVRVLLQGCLEVFDSCFMLFLQTVAVSDDDPGLRTGFGEAKSFLRQGTQLVVLLEMPEASRVVLGSFEAVGLQSVHLLIQLNGLLTVTQLKLTTSHLLLHPGGLKMLLWESVVGGEGFFALEIGLQLVSFAKLPQKSYKVVIGGLVLPLLLSVGALLHKG